MNKKDKGLVPQERTSNNGDDYMSTKFYYEVIRASERFWNNTQVSHFENGVAVRTDIPRRKPVTMGWNEWKSRTSTVPTVVRG
jgi:hypothetical protein